MNLEEMIETGATIVDVRSPEEFMFGNAPGTKNIPLHEVPQRIDEFKAMAKPLILVCASGNRSGQACAFLGAQGIECRNGGSWLDVNYALSRKAG